MIFISQQREKCIGCNYCAEIAEDRWRMSKADGKAVLKGSVNKRGFYNVRVEDHEYEENVKAAEACPVNIIQVRQQ